MCIKSKSSLLSDHQEGLNVWWKKKVSSQHSRTDWHARSSIMELSEVGLFNPLVKRLRSKVLLMLALLSEQLETGKCVEHQSRRFFCQPKQVVLF